MPTLLSVNNYFYRRGGAEAVFLSQNAMLKQKGWTVVPFAMKHEKNDESVHDKHFVDEIEFGQSYGILKKLKMASKVVYSFEARHKIEQCVEKTLPDIAHLHNIYHHISPSILASLKHKNIPTVITLHDLKIACPAYKMLAHDGICERCKSGSILPLIQQKCIKGSTMLSVLVALESTVQRALKLYENADRFVVPSKFYLEKLVEWGWKREKFVYIPNCINIDLFQPDLNPGQSFVFFGRLSEEKGIMTLLEAARIAEVSLDIVGEGELSQAAQDFAKTHALNVTFHGYQSGASLHKLIREARAVVLPSEWYENAPISILEAYALGKPVIGANIGGIPEMVKEGETGTLFPSGDSAKLAKVLQAFSVMPDEQLMNMGQKARAWVESTFSETQYAHAILALYRELGVEDA